MIRRAVAADKFRALMLARSFHAAAALPFPFSPMHAAAVFDASLRNADRLCLVLEIAGKVEGVLVAQAGPHAFGPFKVASELMWWIEPAHRGSGAALRMIAAYEEWARSRDCQFAHIVGLGSDPAVGRIYERRGYQAVERHFMKPLI